MIHSLNKMWSNNLIVGLAIASTFLLVRCSNEPAFQKNPLDELVKSKNEVQNFSVILYDMDYDESADRYKHQYQLLYQPNNNPDTLISEIQPWTFVSTSEFEKYQEDMGMEIAAKKNGVLTKQTSPAGYSEYVGNERYGRWERRSDGTSFWAFYGQYAFMSHLFGMHTYPARYSYWNDYRGNYYGRGRAYYGSNGSRYYGTTSKHNTSRSSSRWNSRPSDFKRNVRSKVQRSSSASRSSSRTSTRSSRRSRSNSRYSSGSSYRSRGGGFGK